MDLEKLKWGADGLIPVVVQDAATRQVLTLAYMNRESLAITLREGQMCFFSRSRQALWRKGETSGNVQRLVSLTADCDGDALVATVDKAGPACHTGEESCFFQPIFGEDGFFSLESLHGELKDRREHPKENSYTSYLFEKGLDKILKKVGEESTEVIIAAKGGNREETVYEAADLSYHMLVLLIEMGISPGEVREELARRHVIDRKVKQEPMS